MLALLVLTLSILGLLSMLKGQHSDTTVYEDDPFCARPSYEVPGYHDDEQIRQFRRREREKGRRASLLVPKR
jgi:hypothetical protein